MRLDIDVTLNELQKEFMCAFIRDIVKKEVTRQLAKERNKVLKNES